MNKTMSQQIIPKLDRNGLRQFGLTFSAIVVCLFVFVAMALLCRLADVALAVCGCS